MANVDIKIFENISQKEKMVFEKFIVDNWSDDNLVLRNDCFLWVVGYRKNKIVGLFCVFKDNSIGEIGQVVTRVDCRRQGVMSQMLQKFMANYLPKYNFTTVFTKVDIKKLGKLFGRVGFVTTGEVNEMKLD
jgi:predicted GNAT family N-acyltransferase